MCSKADFLHDFKLLHRLPGMRFLIWKTFFGDVRHIVIPETVNGLNGAD